MPYLIDGDVVDTYGGDYTYRYVYYEIENGEHIFYEYFSCAKTKSEEQQIIDPVEIADFMKMINN